MAVIGTREDVAKESVYRHFIVLSTECESWADLQVINVQLALKYGPIPSFGNIADIISVYRPTTKTAMWYFRGGPGFCHARRVVEGEAKIERLTAAAQNEIYLAADAADSVNNEAFLASAG